jgi:hypothetical protein
MSQEADEFIDRQVHFQLGAVSRRFHVPLDQMRQARLHPSKFFAVWDAAQNCVLFESVQGAVSQSGVTWAANPAIPKSRRLAAAINSIRPLAHKALYCIDMQDARRGDWRTRIKSHASTFQYNRLSGDKDCILWPLVGYHDINSRYFMSFRPEAEPTFKDKISGVFWRGALTGMALVEGKFTSPNALLRDFTAGILSEDETLEKIRVFSRFSISQDSLRSPVVDAKITLGKAQHHLRDIGFLQPFLSDPIGQERHLDYKYLLCLGGFDIGSSLYWMMNSKSVVFKEVYDWEIFCDCHFKAWEHYVPVQPNLVDLVDKFEWCEQHPHEVQHISENARARCALLASTELRQAALHEVIRTYEKGFEW